jgi:hypothetical protein
MLGEIRSRLTYGNVVATIALIVALGGTAYAAATITGDDVVDNSLTGADIQGHPATGQDPAQDGSLTSNDIKNGTVKAVDLALDSVNSAKVTDDTLTGNDILESSLGKVPNADKLDNRDSSSFGGPTNAYVTTLPGQTALATGVGVDLLSLTLPAGRYLLFASIPLINADGGASHTAQCAFGLSAMQETITMGPSEEGVNNLLWTHVSDTQDTVKLNCAGNASVAARTQAMMAAVLVDNFNP